MKYKKRKKIRIIHEAKSGIPIGKVYSSLLISIQTIVSILTLFFVIIPGKELIEKELMISELSDDLKSVNTDYDNALKRNDELNQYNKELNLKNRSIQQTISENNEILQTQQNDLYNAEITILKEKFIDHSEEHTFKSIYENQDYIDQMNILFKEDRSPDDFHDPLKMNISSIFGYKQIDILYKYFSIKFEDSNLYSKLNDIYKKEYDEINDFINDFENEYAIRDETFNIFKKHLNQHLNQNKLTIDSINDGKIAMLASNWLLMREYLSKYTNCELVTYQEMLESNRNESNEIYEQKKENYERNKNLMRDINEKMNEYNFTISIDNIFYNQRYIINEILINTINDLYIL